MDSFKIATYNIWKNDGDFPKRIYEIPSILSDIDIVCFQEDYEDKEFCSSDIINKKLKKIKISTITRKKKRDDKLSSSNLTILSAYPIKLLDEIYFKKDEDEQRACQFCEISIDNKKIILANTHLCHISNKNREKQIKKILKKMENFKGDIYLLCGDLNTTPNSKEIKKIDKSFISKNIESTYFNGDILNYIFIKSKLDLKIKPLIIPSKLSDHYCLINKIGLKNK